MRLRVTTRDQKLVMMYELAAVGWSSVAFLASSRTMTCFEVSSSKTVGWGEGLLWQEAHSNTALQRVLRRWTKADMVEMDAKASF